jgi:hypothetical protein
MLGAGTGIGGGTRGWVRGDEVLAVQVRALQRNSFCWYLRGSVRPDGTGSVLAGTVGPSRLVAVVSCVLFLILSLFSLAAVVHGALGALVVPVVMALATVGITELGYRWARSGYADLLQTLADALDWPPGWSFST